MEFIKAFGRNPLSLICFFEGEDEKYYSIRVRHITKLSTWSGINCKGKRSALTLREKISKINTYENAKLAFFLDKDFDAPDEINGNNTYITPCYSIENLYTTLECFENTIRAEFGLTPNCPDTDDYQKALDIYNNRKIEFIEAIKPYNIWILAHRLREKSDCTIEKLNLNNVDLNRLVNITLTNVSRVYDPDKLHEMLRTEPIKQHEYEQAKVYFNEIEPDNSFRGKEQIEFFRTLLSKLKEERCKQTSSIFCNRHGVKISLARANILSELSQYATTPTCLESFLYKYQATT